MTALAFESFVSSTLSLAEQGATWIGIGRVTAQDSAAVSPAGRVVSVLVEETLKGIAQGTTLQVFLREGLEGPGFGPGSGPDGFRGLLFLRERALDPDDPDDPPFLGPGDPSLEAPWGLDPDLAVGGPDFAALRAHVEALLSLRRQRLELSLAALSKKASSGSQARLRREAATDIESFLDLETLLRPRDLELLLQALGDPALAGGARVSLLRTLSRMPLAANVLADVLRTLVDADFVAGGFRRQAAQFLAQAADPRDLGLFRRLLDGETLQLRAVGLLGLVNLGGDAALGMVAAVAAEHPDPETRDLAAGLLRDASS